MCIQKWPFKILQEYENNFIIIFKTKKNCQFYLFYGSHIAFCCFFSLSPTHALVTKRLGLPYMYQQFLTSQNINIYRLLNTPIHESHNGTRCAFNIIWLIEKSRQNSDVLISRHIQFDGFTLSSLCSFKCIHPNPKLTWTSKKIATMIQTNNQTT